MTTEVIVTLNGVDHVLRGERAMRFAAILARKYRERPELLHAGRLERRAVEEQAFHESKEG